MSYEEERQLRDERDTANAESRSATRRLAEHRADEHWAEGNRATAVVVLDDAGWSTNDIVDYLRGKGMSDGEARNLIRDAPTNPL